MSRTGHESADVQARVPGKLVTSLVRSDYCIISNTKQLQCYSGAIPKTLFPTIKLKSCNFCALGDVCTVKYASK